VPSFQFFEENPGVVHVGKFESLGEPVVDLGEHRTRLPDLALLFEQTGKAHRRAQFEKPGGLAAANVDRGGTDRSALAG